MVSLGLNRGFPQQLDQIGLGVMFVDPCSLGGVKIDAAVRPAPIAPVRTKLGAHGHDVDAAGIAAESSNGSGDVRSAFCDADQARESTRRLEHELPVVPDGERFDRVVCVIATSFAPLDVDLGIAVQPGQRQFCERSNVGVRSARVGVGRAEPHRGANLVGQRQHVFERDPLGTGLGLVRWQRPIRPTLRTAAAVRAPIADNSAAIRPAVGQLPASESEHWDVGQKPQEIGVERPFSDGCLVILVDKR